MRVILHIGTEKTGTSTIQRFLQINSLLLAEMGVLIPNSPYGSMPSHRKLPAYARNPALPLDDVQLQVIPSEKDRLTFYKTFEEEFFNECCQSGYHTVILSSEHCSSRLKTQEDISRLKALLDRIGKTQILIYLRRQDQLLLSSYATAVRLGDTRPLTLPCSDEEKERFRYRKLIIRWAAEFGRDNMIVRVFSPPRFKNGDLVHDFFDAIDLEIPKSAQNVLDENKSIDAKMLEFLRLFNNFLPHMGVHTGFKPDPRQGNIISILDNISKGDKLLLPTDQVRNFLREFEEGNRWIAREFFNIENDNLFESAEEMSTLGNLPALDLNDAFQIFAEIWAAANSRT
jgi:hypothetical protein